MTWLAENPIWIFLSAVTAIVLLVGIFFQTGQKWLLAAAAVVALLAIGLLIYEDITLTDRERVRRTLGVIASHVEQNDIDAALEYVATDMESLKSAARAELSRYEFGDVEIKRNLTIDVFPDQSPPRAEASFNATVVVKKSPGNFMNNRRVARYLEVAFHKEPDGKWRVIDYRHHEPTYGLKKRPEFD